MGLPRWQYVCLLHAYALEIATQRTFFRGKSANNMRLEKMMEHLDICRILADMACEEHIRQQNNVVEKQPTYCPYYDIKTVDSIDVTANRIEGKMEIEETNQNI